MYWNAPFSFIFLRKSFRRARPKEICCAMRWDFSGKHASSRRATFQNAPAPMGGTIAYEDPATQGRIRRPKRDA